jgi:glycosyltransferase involved in cell wall biosynthesis
MRILLLAPTPYFALRGTPIAVRRVLRFLSAQGHEVEVLTFPFGRDEELPGVRITRCGGALSAALSLTTVPLGPSWRKALLDLALFSRLGLLVVGSGMGRGRRWDCIHAVDELAFGCWVLRPLLRSPLIYDMDSSLEEQFAGAPFWRRLRWLARWVERRMVAGADVVLVVSPELEERVKAINAGKPTFLLPDKPLVTAAMIRAASADASPLPADLPHPLVLYVGNLGAHQGVAELMRAFELERAAGLQCSLAVAGSLDGREAAWASVGPNATLLGELPPERLARVYARSDILASPRLRGSNTPMKVYEYLEAGKPILATRIPAHRRLLGHDGVVWAEPTVEGLRSGLRAAVAEWRRGRRGGGRPASDDGGAGLEPVLEEVYAAMAGH